MIHCLRTIHHPSLLPDIDAESSCNWTHLLGFVLFFFLELDHAHTKHALPAPAGEGGIGMFLGQCSTSALPGSLPPSTAIPSLSDCLRPGLSGISLLSTGAVSQALSLLLLRQPLLTSFPPSVSGHFCHHHGTGGPISVNQRQTSAGVVLGLGLSDLVPSMHLALAEGFVKFTPWPHNLFF